MLERTVPPRGRRLTLAADADEDLIAATTLRLIARGPCHSPGIAVHSLLRWLPDPTGGVKTQFAALSGAASMRSQIATASKRNVRYRPYAFSEQGVAMLSSVLNSDRAIDVNIAIMRAFVRLREILATHKDLARKLDEHERRLGEHDQKIQIVFEAIRQRLCSFNAHQPVQIVRYQISEGPVAGPAHAELTFSRRWPKIAVEARLEGWPAGAPTHCLLFLLCRRYAALHTWLDMTKTFSAIFENGVFRPVEPVDFPERCQVRVEVQSVETATDEASLDEVYAILGKRYNSGESDVAARHNEHQP